MTEFAPSVPVVTGRSAGTGGDDMPHGNAQLSGDLILTLTEEGILDLGQLLFYRGVRTLRAARSLEENEQAVLLGKAREIYHAYGFFPSNLKRAFDNLFANVKASAPAFVYSPSRWAGGGVNSGSSSSGHYTAGPAQVGLVLGRPAQVGPTPMTRARVEELPVALPDDTKLKKSLAFSIAGCRNIVGAARFTEALFHLRRATELSVASCVEMALCVNALDVPKESVKPTDKEMLKAGKLHVRDRLLWLSAGCEGGFDSHPGMIRRFTDTFAVTNCDANSVSRLTGGYRRVKDELAGIIHHPKRESLSPERRLVPGRQDASVRDNTVGQRRRSSRSPHRPACANLAADDGAQASGAAAAELQEERYQALVVMNQPCILSNSLVALAMSSQAPLLAPGGPTRLPPGLEHHTWHLQGSDRSFDKKAENAFRACSLPRRPSATPVCNRSQHPPLYVSNTTVVGEQAPIAANFKPPNVHGDLTTELAKIVLERVAQADDEDCGQCASWVAWALDFTKGDRDKSLVMEAQAILAIAAQRATLDATSLRQVVRSLARVAGSDLPYLEARMPPTLMPMMAETWAWILVDGQDGQRLQLKVDAALDEDFVRLDELTTCTMSFLERCRNKEVARDCCSAMGALGRAGKDMFPLVQRIADWLVETIQQFGGYPEVVHEGLCALVDLCKSRSELLGLDLSREHAGHEHEQQDTLVQHIRDPAMGLARNFEGRSDLHMDILKPAFRLLAHTHPLDQVVRFICGIKNRPSGEMLFCVLDEIDSDLRPAIQEWTKVATSRARAATAEVLDETADGKSSWASSVLRLVQKHGGVGLEALKILSPALAACASVEAWQALDRLNVQMLVDWAKGSSPWRYQDRFFLAGILFDARALLPNLLYLCGSTELFGAGCGALVDLNCLEPLQVSLKRDVAHCILRIPAPQVPSSCTAWVKLIGISINGSADGEWQVIQDIGWQPAERAGWDIARAIRRGLDCEGWPAWLSVLRAALSVLTSIPNSELAAELQALNSIFQTRLNNNF